MSDDPKYKVLITDDEEMNRDMLSRRLVRRGFEAHVAESGPETLALVETGGFDLIILDIMMPDMDGYEVLRRLRQRFSAAELPIIMATAKDTPEDVLAALKEAASDYVTKPINFPILLARMDIHLGLLESRRKLDRALVEVRQLATNLESRNVFIRKVFGRYVADSVVDRLLEQPDALNLGGEQRTLSFMMSDLRGFSALSERLEPTRVVALLNIYLGVMFEIIARYGGSVNDLAGDGIFVLFGAPLPTSDHARQAIACALAMQLAMPEVNAKLAAEGLPSLEMGIGLNTGEAVVGNIGSLEHAKYSAIGRHVNTTSRIEACTVGGQILAADATVQAAGKGVLTGEHFAFEAKGVVAPMDVSDIFGLEAEEGSDATPLRLPACDLAFADLPQLLPIEVHVLSGKKLDAGVVSGHFCKMAWKERRPIAALAAVTQTLHVLDNVKITFPGCDALPGEAYAKITACGGKRRRSRGRRAAFHDAADLAGTRARHGDGGIVAILILHNSFAFLRAFL